ncbi:S8 family serine peptidase [Chloroflexota bacterium]
MKSGKAQTALAILTLASLVFGILGPVTAQTPASPPAEPSARAESAEFRAGELLVKLKVNRTESGPTVRERHNAYYVEDVYGSDVQVWQVPEGQELDIVEDLKADPEVEYAQPNYLYHAHGTPNDPNYDNQWAHGLIRSADAWDITTGSSSVTIAIIDTGIDEAHPDLAGKIVAGRDVVDGDNTPHDLNGHGTHVAGIAAAVTNNGIGIAGLDWQARIMPVRALDEEGYGTTAMIASGVNWAYQNGADILNLSLGGSSPDPVLEAAVSDARAAGSLVVASMGNCRTAGDGCPVANPTMYPAAYGSTIAVAATGPSDSYASYSQYGSHCDIAAPGGDMGYLHDPYGIYSTMPTYDVYLTVSYSYSKNYDYLNGTSQAAPYVAGLAALVWAVDPSLTPSQVQGIIENTAVDLGPAGWDQNYGHGRIDARAALEAVSPPDAPTLYSISNPDGDGNYLVDWSYVPTATSYTLQEDDSPSFTSPTVRYVGSVSQFSVAGHGAGTWYYRVLASNGGGDSPWSNVRSTTVKPGTPNLNAIANPGGEHNYEVSWSASPGATGYTLEEDESYNFTSPTVRYDGPALDHDVVGQEGGTWYYRVRAYNGAGISDWSDKRSATVKPYAPTLDAITNGGNEDEYTVQWSAAAGAKSYTLEEDDSAAFSSPTTRYVGNNTQYSVTGQPGGTWHYRVLAQNAAGGSPWSNTRSTAVDPPGLGAPSLHPIDNVDKDDQYLVDWTGPEEATSYTLEESSSPYFEDPTEVYSGDLPQHQVTGQSGGTWYYRARAFGPGVRGPWSNRETVVVPLWLYQPLVARNYDPNDSIGLPINEGFEDDMMPPDGWLHLETSLEETWKIFDSGSPYEGAYWAGCAPDSSGDLQDEVLLTSEFQAADATLEFYSFGDLEVCRDVSENCDLNIWLVLGSWGGEDDVYLYTADQDWTLSGEWALTTLDLGPHLSFSTPVRIGFQYVGQNGELVGLDAIRIVR